MAATQETKISSNGVVALGTTRPGSGRVVLYFRGTPDSASIAFGYFALNGDDNEEFVALDDPAAITTLPDVVSIEYGANIRYGINVTGGGGSMEISVLVSGDY